MGWIWNMDVMVLIQFQCNYSCSQYDVQYSMYVCIYVRTWYGMVWYGMVQGTGSEYSVRTS